MAELFTNDVKPIPAACPPDESPAVDFAALFAALPCACAVFSPALVILAANDAYLALTNATREGLVGRPVFDAFPLNPSSGRHSRDVVKASLETVLRTGEPHVVRRHRYDIGRPAGSARFEERYWDVVNTPVLRNGVVSAVAHMVEDVTEDVREVRAAEARVARGVEHAVGIAHVGLDGRFLRTNQRFRDILQYDEDALLSRTTMALTHPDDREVSRRQVDLLLTGAVPHYTVEKRYMRADGEPVWVNASRSLVAGPGGRPDYFILVIDDISARKSAEAAVRDGEARLRQLQAELIHLARFTGLGTMASALAHELNQPLTAVASYLGGCRRLLGSHPVDHRAVIADAVERASDQALRAGRILRRLREFVTRREAERHPEDLRSLIEEACALALVGAESCGVRAALRFDPGAPTAFVDRVQLQQVVVNLVRNAMEALDGSPRRDLVVATQAREDGRVEVSVSDSGPGLDPRIAARLFQPFVTTKPDGMGVGLSICRTIIEAQGGTIEAAAGPLGGMVFRCVIDAAEPRRVEDA